MPTEDRTLSPALAGIQASTLAIYDQRRRLNEAFEALQKAAQLIDREAKLLGNGSIQYPDGTTYSPVSSDDMRAVVTPVPSPEPPPPPTPAVIPPPPDMAQSGPQPKSVQRMSKIMTLLEDGSRYTISNIASKIGEEVDAVRYLVNRAVTDGTVVRVDSKPQPTFFKAKPVTSKPLPPETEEERRNNETFTKNVIETAADEGLKEARAVGEGGTYGAPAEAVEAEDPTSTPSMSDASSESKSDGGVADTSQRPTRATATTAPSPGAGYGLARSPKKREDMREPEIIAENRREAIVQWFMDQERPRNVQDFVVEFGTDATAEAELKRDCRLLTERGALIRTGMGYPDYKTGGDVKVRGRTSPIYKPALVGETSPKS